MTARYGDRSRVTSPVGSWGKAGGVGLSEVTFAASPAPAVSSAPLFIGTEEYIVIDLLANSTLSFAGAPIASSADVFLVAGGGGGGRGGGNGGGGGGGGAVSEKVPLAAGPFPIVVGGGGAEFTNGTPTTGFGLTVLGGGAGGSSAPIAPPAGQAGGSGGGSASVPSPARANGGAGSAFGFPGGGNFRGAGGGGGAGARGNMGANADPTLPSGPWNLNYQRGGWGGQGLRTTLPGSQVAYGGGGAGSNQANFIPQVAEGLDGGGNSARIGEDATAGAINSGGGGGAGQAFAPGGGSTVIPATLGKAGGSGHVIVRFKRFQA